jgi:hypothetical protein
MPHVVTVGKPEAFYRLLVGRPRVLGLSALSAVALTAVDAAPKSSEDLLKRFLRSPYLSVAGGMELDRMKRRRMWTAGISSAVVLAGALAVTAGAADNAKLAGSFSFPDSTTCADPIQVTSSYDEQMHTYYDSNGNPIRLAFTGKVEITYTDLVTGSTYSPNSSGPGTVDLQSGQTDLRGGDGAFFDANGNLLATDGHTVLDAGGNVIFAAGHQTGVCEKLDTAPA